MPKPLKPTIMILKNLPTAKKQFTVHGFLAQGSTPSQEEGSSNDQSNDQSCTAVPDCSLAEYGPRSKKGKKKKR